MNEQDSNMAANGIIHAASMAFSGIEQNFSYYSLWAVIYKLVPFKDGSQWCVLLGENIQDGVVGFGDTPTMAIYNFDKAMNSQNGGGK